MMSSNDIQTELEEYLLQQGLPSQVLEETNISTNRTRKRLLADDQEDDAQEPVINKQEWRNNRGKTSGVKIKQEEIEINESSIKIEPIFGENEFAEMVRTCTSDQEACTASTAIKEFVKSEKDCIVKKEKEIYVETFGKYQPKCVETEPKCNTAAKDTSKSPLREEKRNTSEEPSPKNERHKSQEMKLLAPGVVIDAVNKPFVCEYCDKGFSMAYSLKLHLKIHAGSHPYNCCKCSEKFQHRDELDFHVQMVHTKRQVKPSHVRIHLNQCITCDQIDRGFKKKFTSCGFISKFLCAICSTRIKGHQHKVDKECFRMHNQRNHSNRNYKCTSCKAKTMKSKKKCAPEEPSWSAPDALSDNTHQQIVVKEELLQDLNMPGESTPQIYKLMGQKCEDATNLKISIYHSGLKAQNSNKLDFDPYIPEIINHRALSASQMEDTKLELNEHETSNLCIKQVEEVNHAKPKNRRNSQFKEKNKYFSKQHKSSAESSEVEYNECAQKNVWQVLAEKLENGDC